MRTWRPDTCGCCIEEIYNTADNITGGGKVLIKCADHNGVTDGLLYDVLLNQNRRKNAVHASLIYDLGLDNGSGELKSGVEYNWTYSGKDDARILQVIVSGISTKVKTDLQSICDTKFGVGKVQVT